MSKKETCPNCRARTTGVWEAARADDPCPYCGHKFPWQNDAQQTSHAKRYGFPVPGYLTHDEAEIWVEGYRAAKEEDGA